MRKEVQGGELALQQVRIKQAQDELAWARQIHDTKAVEAQRRIIESQATMAELGVKKAQREMESEDEIPLDKNTLETVLGARASGLDIALGPHGRQKVRGKLSPEATAAARQEYDEYMKQQAMPRLEAARIAAQGGVDRAMVAGQFASERTEIMGAVQKAITDAKIAGKLTEIEKQGLVDQILQKLRDTGAMDRTKAEVQGRKDTTQMQTKAQSDIAAENRIGRQAMEQLEAETQTKIAAMRNDAAKIQNQIDTYKVQIATAQTDLSPEGQERLQKLNRQLELFQAAQQGGRQGGQTAGQKALDDLKAEFRKGR
jgi:hypothetical protein